MGPELECAFRAAQEMTITVFLLFNVLWMAFELQVHGSMNGGSVGDRSTVLAPVKQYPLAMTNITMENHHFFWQIHYKL